ncbi:MAG: stage sporulation protein [Nitrospirae bacterium]|nr:stage sporulation protein [Nitrospirota bacterium]MBS1126546.1 stage sporulation protein [Nitrospirota bacterium]MBS1234552.1 stage sporulation protein [Nitrospirota bacterium]
MVFNHKIYAERAKSQQVKAEDIQVRRGNIYDRRGRAFAVNLELESLYCDPEEVVADRDGLKRLSGILGMDTKLIQAKFRQEKRFIWVNRMLAPEKAGEIKKLNIKGIGFLPEAKRFYPRGVLASHVIGMVGRENQPLEGLELKYDKYLRTAGGKVYYARDASGKKLSSGVDTEAKGNDLLLTIDEGLQYIVEKELENAMTKWRSVAASAIMMDPFTGEILALANRPAYDLNAGSSNKNAIRNRVITDIYEPGSTFKVIVGTAALEEKIYKLDSAFDCSRGGIEVGGKFIRDAHKHGVLTFHEVIQKSSNVGSIMIGMKLGKERLYRYAKLYGFGEETGIDMPGEVSGWIRKPEKWSATSIGAIPIGQEVAVTPLQILRAYSVIANGGYLIQPHLVSEIRTPEGQTIFSFKGTSRRILTEKTAEVFKNILKTVVEDGGTATEAAVEGNPVAGKTGTAQLIDSRTGRYSRDRFISSFVGFVPADNPKIAMIVIIYEPKGQIYGGIVAGPVFRDIADQALSYMNVPMDENYRKDLLLVSK